MLVVTHVLRARHLARKFFISGDPCRRSQLRSRSIADIEHGGHCDLVVRGDYSGCTSARAFTRDEEARLRLQETCKVGHEGRDVVT